MNLIFRKFKPSDKNDFLVMVKKFYSPPAVLHFPPESVMLSVFDAAIEMPELVKGYIFEIDEKPVGYSVVSMKFETEVGGMAAWIEELYVDDEYRGKGIGHRFFDFIGNEFKGKINRLRLEVGDENDGAKRLYKNLGFEPLDYKQMVIDKEF